MELVIAVQIKKKNHHNKSIPTIFSNTCQFTIQSILHNKLLAAFSDKAFFNLSWHAVMNKLHHLKNYGQLSSPFVWIKGKKKSGQETMRKRAQVPTEKGLEGQDY